MTIGQCGTRHRGEENVQNNQSGGGLAGLAGFMICRWGACAALCHKGDFNPSWMVNAVLLLDLFYVTLICTLGQEPKIFIELFLRNNSFWWLKTYLLRLIHIFQFTCLLCT